MHQCTEKFLLIEVHTRKDRRKCARRWGSTLVYKVTFGWVRRSSGTHAPEHAPSHKPGFTGHRPPKQHTSSIFNYTYFGLSQIPHWTRNTRKGPGSCCICMTCLRPQGINDLCSRVACLGRVSRWRLAFNPSPLLFETPSGRVFWTLDPSTSPYQ